jgi:hypothetical protein
MCRDVARFPSFKLVRRNNEPNVEMVPLDGAFAVWVPVISTGLSTLSAERGLEPDKTSLLWIANQISYDALFPFAGGRICGTIGMSSSEVGAFDFSLTAGSLETAQMTGQEWGVLTG